ncbi:MAG: sugar phosphate isomerase/epimerase [Clostridia bacterium]|nr:sugar phosphate isomerase/epimerase [Clostridia bacterium]
MKTLPVALQLYSVRDEMEAAPEETLRAVKEMGYTGVEFGGLYGHDAADLKAMCEKYELIPISAHIPLNDMVKDPDGTIAPYAALGVKYVVMPYLDEDRRPGTAGFERTIADVKHCAEAAKKYSIKMLYHNHDFEFVKINGEYALDIIYREISEDLLATEIDTCWVKVAGEDPANYVRKYTNRSPIVHLKDFMLSGEKPANMYELMGIEQEGETASEEAFGFRPLGLGLQDVPSLLEASLDAGALWVVVEQDRPALGLTPMESVQKSREYLKSLGW